MAIISPGCTDTHTNKHVHTYTHPFNPPITSTRNIQHFKRTHPLAGLVDLGDVHVGERLDELGGVEQVVGPLRRQDLVLLLDLCVWVCVQGGWWGRDTHYRIPILLCSLKKRRTVKLVQV